MARLWTNRKAENVNHKADREKEKMIACADQGRLDQDRDLELRVSNYLAERLVPALRRVAVQARQGRVTFRGRVGSFYEKQLVLNCFHAVPGVESIEDHMDVA